MSYLDLLQKFWNYNKESPIGSTAISVYLFLLNEWHENNYNEFQISDYVLSKHLILTRKTIKSKKELLRNLGLISFQSRNTFPCIYKINVDYITTNSKTKKNQEQKQQLQPPTFPPIIIEEKQVNQEVNQEVVSKKLNSKIPSQEIFIEYAKTLDDYNINLNSKIIDKYNDWVGNGWKNGYGVPIRDWEKSLRNTMPYLVKENHSNEISSIKSVPNINRPKSTYNE